MKTLILSVLLLLLTGKSYCMDHDDFVHDAAHFGCSALMVEMQECLFRLDPQTKKSPWTVFFIEVSVSVAVNEFYEGIENHDTNTSIERDVSALLGAGIVSYSIHF